MASAHFALAAARQGSSRGLLSSGTEVFRKREQNNSTSQHRFRSALHCSCECATSQHFSVRPYKCSDVRQDQARSSVPASFKKLGQWSNNPGLTRSGQLRVGPKRKRCIVVAAAAKKTFGSFEELIDGSEQPVLVDWYADYCGPCHMMTPVLNEVSSVLKPHLKVVKIDTQKYPALASKYSIKALPTLVLFKDGKIIDRLEGALNANQLIGRLRHVLKIV